MSQNPTHSVAAEVRAELGRQGHNNAWLAAQLGVTQMWVSRRLRGETRITEDDLKRIAAVLGMPPADLFRPAVRAA